MKRKDISATAFLSNAIIMLENLPDMEDSPLYSKQAKYYGNRFINEFRDKVVKVESYVSKNEEEFKLIQEIQIKYEAIISKVAKMDIYELDKTISILTQLEEGKIVSVSEEKLKELQNEER